MPQQLSLPGLDPTPTDGLFFAILPDAATARRTAEVAAGLRGQYGLHGKPLAPRRFHVSLYGLGSYAGLRRDIVAKASAAAATLTETSFGIAFDRAGTYAGRRRETLPPLLPPPTLPLVLRSGTSLVPLIRLRQQLIEAMARYGLRPRRRESYDPHMTLLYDARLVDMRSVEPVRWTAREVVLVHSLLGRSKHIALARWPLRESGPGEMYTNANSKEK